ncbi:NAD kinase [Parasaccharibacter sp. TMW2.1882]|uniref:NAD kinase n=2 Tax=Acetobacteraceae TaxID=433 RepID=A0A7U7G4R7_9PROT|nr:MULTISPECIES: NAD kinase [Acetobacteraceae]MCL1562439.1 NAD kinase [Parasaccharibacter sp. TMW 2.1886]MCQ0040798.1 NAD kinase [Bombella sp.]MUG79864.1 NAD kinase [Bombella sp. ESL0380]QGT75472.1 NAD kinase [Bombella sp. ESL0368]MBE1723795.1 NAD kinase [Bombella apis]
MNIAFVAASTEAAQEALERFTERYGNVPLDQAEVLVCLGGDGFMLETLLHICGSDIPVFGMNYGTIGFLMNSPAEDHLPQRLAYAQHTEIAPLHMWARTKSGELHEGVGFNDVFLYRETRQTVHIGIEIDGRVRMSRLICDGIILATPAGSTAYNRSAHGPIIPLGAELLSLTPISPFQPRHWRGALLPAGVTVRFTLYDTDKRPASAVAGPEEIRDVSEVIVRLDDEKKVTLLFDPDHSLSERIIAEQFAE